MTYKEGITQKKIYREKQTKRVAKEKCQERNTQRDISRMTD